MDERRGPFSPEELARFAVAWNESSILRWLCFRVSFPGGQRVRVAADPVVPGQRGGKGTDAVNGGILAALFDFAIGACSVVSPPLRQSATMQLSMNFERAVRGDRVACEATVERQTKNALFVSALIFDERDQVCARGSGLVNLGAPVTYDEWLAMLRQGTSPEDSSRSSRA